MVLCYRSIVARTAPCSKASSRSRSWALAYVYGACQWSWLYLEPTRHAKSMATATPQLHGDLSFWTSMWRPALAPGPSLAVAPLRRTNAQRQPPSCRNHALAREARLADTPVTPIGQVTLTDMFMMYNSNLRTKVWKSRKICLSTLRRYSLTLPHPHTVWLPHIRSSVMFMRYASDMTHIMSLSKCTFKPAWCLCAYASEMTHVEVSYDDDVYFYNSTASTWTLATPRTTWESVLSLPLPEAGVPGTAWPTIAWPDMSSSSSSCTLQERRWWDDATE